MQAVGAERVAHDAAAVGASRWCRACVTWKQLMQSVWYTTMQMESTRRVTNLRMCPTQFLSPRPCPPASPHVWGHTPARTL
eukprot:3790908-Rhodomonas_salina.1